MGPQTPDRGDSIPVLRDIASHGGSVLASPHLDVRRLVMPDIPPDRQQYHRHPFFELFWINAGQGEHFNDFRTFPVGPGSVVWVAAGTVHAWRALQPLRGFVVSFMLEDVAGSGPDSGSIVEGLPLFFDRAGSMTATVPPEERTELDAQFESLSRELHGDPASAGLSPVLRSEAARSLLKLLLIRVQRIAGVARGVVEPHGPAALARRYLLELERSYLHLCRVEDYAVRLGVTANHLVETVRQQLGMTPGQLIDQRLFLEARRLLYFTTKGSAEIGHLLGFRTPGGFARFFHRQAGLSPRAARAQFHKTGQISLPS